MFMLLGKLIFHLGFRFFFVVTRDNWPREERSWTSLVFSVVRGSLFVICFLIVVWPNVAGVLFLNF
jgi:hypothetical protein